MKHTVKSLIIAALLSAVLPAQAAIQNYNFNGAIDSGFYLGETFTGNFSFDDASLTLSGNELINLNAVNMSFLSTTFTEINFTTAAPAVVFQNGVLSGLEWSFDSTTPNIGFSFIPGTLDTSDAFVSYETTSGVDGGGNVNYSAVAAVPEPETYAMLLVGLALVGFAARRRQSV